MQCYERYNYDKIDPRFFVAHPDLKWIMTNGSSYNKVDGALKIKYLFMGRINVTYQGQTYQQIGKIWSGNLYYRDPATNQEIVHNGAFEILACTPCSYQVMPGDPCCKF